MNRLDVASGWNEGRVSQLKIAKLIEPNLVREAIESADAIQEVEAALSVMDVAVRVLGPEWVGLQAE